MTVRAIVIFDYFTHFKMWYVNYASMDVFLESLTLLYLKDLSFFVDACIFNLNYFIEVLLEMVKIFVDISLLDFCLYYLSSFILIIFQEIYSIMVV